MPTSAIYLLSPATRTIDVSGNGHTLTIAQTVNDAAGLTGVASRGGRMTGDGTDFRVPGEIDVSAYVNLDSSSGDRWVAACEKQGANGKTWWKFGVLGNRSLVYGYDHASGHQDISVKPGIMPASGWVNLRFLRESDELTIRFWVNGELVATEIATNSAAGGSAADLNVMNDAYNLADHRMQQLFLTVR